LPTPDQLQDHTAWTTADKLAWEDRAICDHRLLPIDRVVAAYLRGKFNVAKGGAYPSHKTIASKLGVSERTVWSALKRLEALGYLRRRRRGRGRTDLYALSWPHDPAPKTRSQLRVLEGDGEAQDPQPFASADPQTIATPESQAVATESIESDPFSVSPDDDAPLRQHHHRDDDAAGAGWPDEQISALAVELCRLACIDPASRLGSTAGPWLQSAKAQGYSWSVARLAALKAAFSSPGGFSSCAYFTPELARQADLADGADGPLMEAAITGLHEALRAKRPPANATAEVPRSPGRAAQHQPQPARAAR